MNLGSQRLRQESAEAFAASDPCLQPRPSSSAPHWQAVDGVLSRGPERVELSKSSGSAHHALREVTLCEVSGLSPRPLLSCGSAVRSLGRTRRYCGLGLSPEKQPGWEAACWRMPNPGAELRGTTPVSCVAEETPPGTGGLARRRSREAQVSWPLSESPKAGLERPWEEAQRRWG